MPTLTIKAEALTRLAPCALAVDDDNVVQWVSKPLAKYLAASICGQQLDRFVVPGDRPFATLVLSARDGAALPLRGCWVSSVGNPLRVFVGAPTPTTIEEMNQLGIKVEDFPQDDPWLNYLIQLDECAATQRDAVERITQLKEERVKLKKARDEMRDAQRATLNVLSDVEQARKNTERAHAELQSIQRQLLDASRRAGMAEVATGVLHNVGNVLNSVNVAAGVVAEKIRRSRVPNLAKTVELMAEHAGDLGTFITQDEKGRQLPGYLAKLAEHLAGEQAAVLEELGSLSKNIEHLKSIISMQQSYAGVAGLVEPASIIDLMEDALKINAAGFGRHHVQVVREYTEVPPVLLDKHRLLLILVNVLNNGKYALAQRGGPDRRLTLRVGPGPDDRVRIEVADNGVGIPPENLTRIFSHGFTTKKGGRGFGLHSSALAAGEMGGSLTAHSDGPGQGATFRLELPLRPAEAKR